MLLAATLLLILLESENSGTPWLSVPGFEIWRIFNLAVFVLAMYFVLRRPLSAAFQARREGIRRELSRAKEEKAAAEAKLIEVEERLTRLNAEVEAIQAKARLEASEEQARLSKATSDEVRRLREQAQREIEIAGKAARQDLQHFTAEQSVQLAAAMLQREIRPEDDERLMKSYIEDLGGVRR